ncbi:hypothetical protein EG328_006074 [Venturia inaequalis]|uniref:Uncharacterized protein n=1 Tax=Venturia inaequalis TaxID=5025 RepID=A0A8H3YRP6_VENIN|nr:hypothetical protein EG328_006074 [Venturia inaequalis]KAE9991466.1 hypothetical protein EG327_011628 [Venturia inaequalis]
MLSYSLLVALLAASVSAKKHRLCCCAGFNACNQFVCDDVHTQNLVNTSNGKFARSNQSWDKDTGAPCGGLKNWMYALGKDKGDDDWLGGNEVSDLCELAGLSSRCFNPKSGKYNGRLMIKGRQVEKIPTGGSWTWGGNTGDTIPKPPAPVVGGGKRGSKQGKGGDLHHFPTCG